MPSYRDFSLDNGQYIQQYAGVPLEELQKTGDVLAGRHYSNLAQLSQLKLLAEKEKSQLLPGAKSYVDEHINQIDSALAEIARSGGENATAKVQAMANTYLGDQVRLNALARSEEAAKARAKMNDIAATTGKEAVYDKNAWARLHSAAPVEVDENGNTKIADIYNSPLNLEIQPYQDPTIDYKKIVDEIKSDRWISENLQGNEPIKFKNAIKQLEDGSMDIHQFVEWATSQGIPHSKIVAMKEHMFRAYKNSKSYDQGKRFLNKTDEQMKEDLFNYGELGVYNQIDKHYQQVSSTGKGAGNGAYPGGTPYDRESIGARQVAKIKTEYDPDSISIPKKPEPTNTTQSYGVGTPQVFGSRISVYNPNTQQASTNKTDRQAEAEAKYNENLAEFEKKAEVLNQEAKLAESIFGKPRDENGKEIDYDVKTPQGLALAKQSVKKYREWAASRMENQSIDKVPQEVKPGTIDKYGMIVKDVPNLTKDVLDNISRRKVWSLPDEEGNTVQDSNQETRPQWEDLLKGKKDELVATGYLDPLGPVARQAGPEFMGAPVIQYTDKDTGKVYQYAVTRSEGEMYSPGVQKGQIMGQAHDAFGSKPGQEVSVPIKVFTPSGWIDIPVSGKELVGGQRDEVLEYLKVANPDEYARAVNFPRMYSVKKPGSEKSLIYYDLSQVADDILTTK